MQLPPGTPRPPESTLVPGALVFAGTDAPVPLNDYTRWWKFVPGANWRHPAGPDSSIVGKENHPVVQVSYEDALAYARWAHKRLPTEAEWEYAARGGLQQADFAWGAEFAPGGRQMANTWNDSAHAFPVNLPDAHDKVQVGTSPVGSFPANGYGSSTWRATAANAKRRALSQARGVLSDAPSVSVAPAGLRPRR